MNKCTNRVAANKFSFYSYMVRKDGGGCVSLFIQRGGLMSCHGRRLWPTSSCIGQSLCFASIYKSFTPSLQILLMHMVTVASRRGGFCPGSDGISPNVDVEQPRDLRKCLIILFYFAGTDFCGAAGTLTSSKSS